MKLPDDFQFSASSLQDFVDCPRRFYLRCVRQLVYPAAEAEPLRPFEQHVERAVRFHHLIHQHQIGIPVDALEAMLPDEIVAQWWKDYRAHAPADLPEKRLPEITLSAPLGDRRIVARYDLLAIGERAVIVDWKTALVRPERRTLERRLQTRVYPYLLAQAGAHLNGGTPIDPAKISLIYWFAEFPQQPEVFTYSAEQYERDGAYLEALAADIARRGEDDFPLTDDTDFCRYCAYRSLNGRGAAAGDYHVDAFADERADFESSFPRDETPEINR
ncbi:MAG: PD-(D/E)XK nuclease family protein [Anaerolineae bacterium]|nr:PD-(D/E)XK nuclease family protein [Anaerolineae bacterium]